MMNKNYFISFVFDDGSDYGLFHDNTLVNLDHEITAMDIAQIELELAETYEVIPDNLRILCIFQAADDEEPTEAEEDYDCTADDECEKCVFADSCLREPDKKVDDDKRDRTDSNIISREIELVDNFLEEFSRLIEKYS